MNTTPRESVPLPEFAGSLYGMYLVSVAVCLGGNLMVRVTERAGWLPPSLRIVLAIVTAIPLVVAAALFWRMLRQGLDEMLQRIVLEGLAFALIVYLPLAGLYVNLRSAGVWMPRLDPPDILLTPAVLVAIGVALAWRRYR
jgi:hypothetical protein